MRMHMEICYSSCIIGHREGNKYWGVDIYDQKRTRTYITAEKDKMCYPRLLRHDFFSFEPCVGAARKGKP